MSRDVVIIKWFRRNIKNAHSNLDSFALEIMHTEFQSSLFISVVCGKNIYA